MPNEKGEESIALVHCNVDDLKEAVKEIEGWTSNRMSIAVYPSEVQLKRADDLKVVTIPATGLRVAENSIY